MQHYDHIIVGQGLAGSVLATQLMWLNKKVLVIDEPSLSLSSRVAAGIWNPVVFKRLTKSWMADEVLPEMFSFYLKTEKQTETKFIHFKNIAKQFSEEQEKILWLKKSELEMYNYLDDVTYQHHPLTGNEFSLVLNSGNLSISLFLKAVEDELKKQKAYLHERFDYSKLSIEKEIVCYKSYTTNSLMFCEGYRCMENPWFNWVPFKPAKGEVLTIRCESLDLNHILNKGFFILPLGNQLFKVGATYEWSDLSQTPTEKGKQELTDKLDKTLNQPYTIVKHEAGVRPSIIDRRPVIGNHPIYPAIKIFNGLGTKGVMLAPYFAKQFINFTEQAIPLNKEISIERFYKYYSPQENKH